MSKPKELPENTAAAADRPVDQSPALAEEYSLTNHRSMMKLSVVLAEFIKKSNLTVPIQGKDYVMVEAWTYAGMCMGLLPVVTSLQRVACEGTEIKYEAVVELKNVHSNEIVGRAVALCSNKEGRKKHFDEYAVASMAQTRATGKAYRLPLGWLMKAAGYESTPAEEMKTDEDVIFEKLAAMVTITKATSREELIKALKDASAFRKDADILRVKDIMNQLYPNPAKAAGQPEPPVPESQPVQAVPSPPPVVEETTTAEDDAQLRMLMDAASKLETMDAWLKFADANFHFQGVEGFDIAMTQAKERIYAASLATADQKTQILLLLKDPVITREEKDKMVNKLSTFDKVRAEQAIARLKKTIQERSTQKVSAV